MPTGKRYVMGLLGIAGLLTLVSPQAHATLNHRAQDDQRDSTMDELRKEIYLSNHPETQNENRELAGLAVDKPQVNESAVKQEIGVVIQDPKKEGLPAEPSTTLKEEPPSTLEELEATQDDSSDEDEDES